MGVGIVRESKVTQEEGCFETKVLCNEAVHCGTNVEIMKKIATSETVKVRLGDIDVTLPKAFIDDVKEIVSQVESGQSYGA